MLRFSFKLAGHLKMSQRELLANMSTSEFLDWWLLSGIEPFGEDREDLRNAINCCVTGQPYSKKNLKPNQFIINDPKTKKELASTLKSIAKSYGQ